MLSRDVEAKITTRAAFGPWTEYVEVYERHLKLREWRVPASRAEVFGDGKQMRSNSLVLAQALVHRAVGLFEGALYAASASNFYSMVLSIRGHFETTAALGYLHSRLTSLKRGTIDAATFHQNVTAQVMGSRDKAPEFPVAKQILDMLDHADRSVSVHLLRSAAKEHDILTDCYQWLSEFCHPNRHSNTVAIDLDKRTPEFRIRHNEQMRDEECGILEYLLLSGSIFVDLFKQVDDLVSDIL